MTQQSGNQAVDPTRVWDRAQARRDYLHIFERPGGASTRNDLEYDDWKAWKLELVKKLQLAIWFFYGNFVHGVRRCVIDGVEPTDRPSESFQFDLFEYIYHQILHKDADWVAATSSASIFSRACDEVLAHLIRSQPHRLRAALHDPRGHARRSARAAARQRRRPLERHYDRPHGQDPRRLADGPGPARPPNTAAPATATINSHRPLRSDGPGLAAQSVIFFRSNGGTS